MSATVDPSLAFADLRCRACGYPLAGLADARCPECGESFDPADPRTFARGAPFADAVRKHARAAVTGARVAARAIWRVTRPRLPFAAGCCASWLLFGYGLSLLFWVPAVALAARRRFVAAAMCAALGPFGVTFAQYATSYARGGWQFVRPPGNPVQTEQGNLDRATRLRGFDPGCGTHDENHWLRQFAERAARDTMHAVIGPPPGAYRGPYPTLDEARAALATAGIAQRVDVLDHGAVAVDGMLIQLDDDLSYYGFVVNRPDASRVTATLDRRQCLIVRVPRDADPPAATLYLIDAATGRAFAVYFDDAPTP